MSERKVVMEAKSATITISGPSKVQERGNKRLISCLIVGCDFPTTQIKVHSFNDYLPRIFDERIDDITDDVNKTRMRALMQVTTWVLGKPGNLDDLLKFVNMLEGFNGYFGQIGRLRSEILD